MVGAHVFVVDRNTYPVHRDRRFCGVKAPRNKNSLYGVYADILTVREGDLIFFYKRRIDEPPEKRGFLGVFKAVGRPFVDETTIKGINESRGLRVRGKGKNRLPTRLLIKPYKYYSIPIDDNTAYIDRDFIKRCNDILWTMIFRKTSGGGRARSITHLFPWEGKKLLTLLAKRGKRSNLPCSKPYTRTNRKFIKIDGDIKSNNGLTKSESILEAWFMENYDKSNDRIIRELFGRKPEFVGNGVLYGIGGEKVDILCINKKNGLKNATVIELKKGNLTKGNINSIIKQVDKYSKYMSQMITNSNKKRIQPVIIAHKISPELVRVTKRELKKTKPPIFIEYEVENGTIKFKKI